jgi:hypothetical protein
MVRALTPFRPGSCCSSRKISSRADGRALEHLVVLDLEEIVAHLEARVERAGRRLRVEQDGLLEQLQQHLVQPGEFLHRPVVLLHELLDREGEAGILVAEHLRQLDLVVEQQPVLAPPGDGVQRPADAPQEVLAGEQPAVLVVGEEALLGELVQAADAEVAARHPADHLDVAQAAGAALDVGLEVVGGVVVAVMAGGLLGALGLEELPRGHSRSGLVAACMASNSAAGPSSRRDSISVVTTVTSASACRAHSATERTLWPTSSPMSHRKVRKAATRSRQAPSPSGTITRMSMSEQGCSSPRP